MYCILFFLSLFCSFSVLPNSGDKHKGVGGVFKLRRYIWENSGRLMTSSRKYFLFGVRKRRVKATERQQTEPGKLRKPVHTVHIIIFHSFYLLVVIETWRRKHTSAPLQQEKKKKREKKTNKRQTRNQTVFSHAKVCSSSTVRVRYSCSSLFFCFFWFHMVWPH